MPTTDRSAGKNCQEALISHSEPYLHQQPDPEWQSPRNGCSLSSTDVHIWRGWLDQPRRRVDQLAQSLSADERMRADRFRFETDRVRFIIARGMLRLILGQYLDTEPGRVQLCYGSHGKPHLRDGTNQPLIRFSVAHSHQMAAYGFTCAREIGVDLEYARPMPRMQQAASAFMSARELALLSALPIDQQQQAFYLCWTRKEAYVKARGVGLAQPLQRLDMSMTPGEPARLLSVEAKPYETWRWALQSFTPAPGYVAALAVQGHGMNATYWDSATLHPAYDLGKESHGMKP
jgi:4'-phosphopantetheinyl transferase